MSEIEEVSTDLTEVQELAQKLKAANDEAASYRVKLKELRDQFDAEQASVIALKQSVVQTQIDKELAAQGITNAKYGSMIKPDDIEFDNNGNATNLVERVGQLKADFPEAADAKRRAPKVDASDKQPSTKPLSSAEKLLQQTN